MNLGLTTTMRLAPRMRLVTRVDSNLKSSTRGSLLTLLILFAAAPVIQSECPPIRVISGSGVDIVGQSAASAGDVNNDGFDDIIIGAYWTHRDSANIGRVFVFSGLNGDTLFVFNGEADGDQFGKSVASAGDVNNDGHVDFIVSAHLNNTGGRIAGRVYVFSGLNGETLHVFTGMREDVIGTTVASAGDVNNDGYDDLFVGAQRVSGLPGVAYVFSGKNGDTLYVFNGVSIYDGFGGKVANAGDVNNDGYPDLLVIDGGCINSGDVSYCSEERAARAIVFSGLDGDTLHVFSEEEPSRVIGLVASSAGDVNNDGYGDLIVGSPEGVVDGDTVGYAYVYSGLNGETLHIFSGEMTNDYFGYSVASAGDVDNDGFDDLIVGAIGNSANGSRAGRVYVFSGLTGDTLKTFTGRAKWEQFGLAVASAGDVDNDGYSDLIVGAHWYDDLGIYLGKVYVFSGAPRNCCCFDITGNIDCDPNSVVDIADLTTLIDHLFVGLQPLCCKEEGNVNGDAQGEVDIADLTALIDHLFVSLISTPACQ